MKMIKMNDYKILINQLKLESMENLSKEEKKETVLRLRNKYNLTYDQISEKTNVAKSTMHHWIEGRNDNPNFNIETFVTKLKNFNPKTSIHYACLESLKKIIIEKLKNKES